VKRIGFIMVALSLALLLSGVVVGAKEKLTYFYTEYDGVPPEYITNLEDSFNAANPDIDLEIVSIPWNIVHDKLLSSIAGGKPPDISVIGTRWLLEFLEMDVCEPIEGYLSKELLANIEPATLEAKIKGVLYAIPVAAGPRFMFYRKDVFRDHGIGAPPDTFQEMLGDALMINNPPDMYGVGMIGKKYVELTEFAYYILGNDGYFFETNPDGSYGKCRVNDEAGVQAMTFMNDLVNKYKVTEPAVTGKLRADVMNIFVSGKLGICLIGTYLDSLLRGRGATFEWDYALMPRFAGKPQCALNITDSIMLFKSSQHKEAAIKFIEFAYQDEWRFEFNKYVGFPPVLKSVALKPYYQKPIYKICVESLSNAKGWPLITEWPECSDIIWSEIQEVFLNRKTPKEAMDDAAAEIDMIRGM